MSGKTVERNCFARKPCRCTPPTTEGLIVFRQAINRMELNDAALVRRLEESVRAAKVYSRDLSTLLVGRASYCLHY